VLTWQKEGKEHRVRLQFGPNNTLTATPEREENNAKTRAKTAEQPANAPASEAQNKIIGSVLLRSGANGQGGQSLPMHQGVYIETSDFLCLFLSQGFESEMHGQQAAGAEKAATPNAPKQQAARPAQNAANTPQQAQAPNANADKNAQAVHTLQQGTEVKGATTTGTTQAKNEPAAKAGETRTANYGAEQHHAGNMQQKGFVLILRREGTQQPQGRGK
jgi:hypothetical protein